MSDKKKAHWDKHRLVSEEGRIVGSVDREGIFGDRSFTARTDIGSRGSFISEALAKAAVERSLEFTYVVTQTHRVGWEGIREVGVDCYMNGMYKNGGVVSLGKSQPCDVCGMMLSLKWDIALVESK